MPTIITHGFVGFISGKLSVSSRKLLLLSTISSIIPDFDAIAFKLNIAYSSLFGHRGITHSVFFAILLSLILFLAFFLRSNYTNKQKSIIYLTLFLSIMSHSVLDAFTDGGLGVAFLAPFLNDRFFFGFHFIPVAPIALAKVFSIWGLKVILSEIAIIWIPLIFLFYFIKRKKTNL